jgi:hypothetical protein
VYGKACLATNEISTCQFDNPLSSSPRSQPNVLRCTSSPDNPAGNCLLGPQKHGDGCKHENECASGNCVKQLGICEGVPEMNQCRPGFPDPCAAGKRPTYCAPNPASPLGGFCAAVIPVKVKCNYPTACERGTFCAGPSPDDQKCIPLFSVANLANTTLGPYMCESANALLTDSANGIYQCVDPAVTQIGIPCNLRDVPPPGYECKCSRKGQTFLRPVGGLGLSARATVWKDLYKCLIKSAGPMGDLCQFDAADMTSIRYGSCAYYGCYPLYLKLMEATGSRIFKDPLLDFEPTASCEVESANSFYDRVSGGRGSRAGGSKKFSAGVPGPLSLSHTHTHTPLPAFSLPQLLTSPCIQIPGMDTWKCASLNPYDSLSVGDTTAVMLVIFAGVWGGYLYHMWYFRKENGVVFPCRRLN